MPIEITTLDQLDDLVFDETIDVRSPAEYAEDHIPGAISLPVLSNAERARVGTIYVQQDRFKARKIGAALVARNAARHLEGPLATRDGGWRPLVYCWRGGQRSNSFASILSQIGWRADTIAGGYQSYRRLVVKALYKAPLPVRVILIDGGTGTAKTRLLHHLAGAGAQTLDLEALAAHRGSLFGALDGGQPAQKGFESRLAEALRRLDPARPVYLEAESSRIGTITLPPSLWERMRAAAFHELRAPAEARADHLLASYPDMTEDAERLDTTLLRLRPYQGGDKVEAWRTLARSGAYRALAVELIRDHYDPRYGRLSRAGRSLVAVHEMPALNEATLARTASEIVKRSGL